jgi:hypothetical protein
MALGYLLSFLCLWSHPTGELDAETHESRQHNSHRHLSHHCCRFHRHEDEWPTPLYFTLQRNIRHHHSRRPPPLPHVDASSRDEKYHDTLLTYSIRSSYHVAGSSGPGLADRRMWSSPDARIHESRNHSIPIGVGFGLIALVL